MTHARGALLALALLAGALLPGCFGETPGLLDVGAEIERPGPVALASPPHGARVDGQQATFTWSYAGNVTGWSARLLLDGAPVDACPFEEGRTSCTLALGHGRVYRWAVQALVDGEAPLLSSERGLRTNAPPTAPVIEAGDEGSSQAPLDLRFVWGAARDPEGDALTYRVTVRNASGERVACETTTETSCVLPWRLRAADAITMTVWARDAYGLEGPPATVNVTARRPVVFLHGWTGDATTWAIMAPELAADGFHVLDFDAAAPGLQLLAFAPDARNETIEEIAATDVLPEIRRALAAAGLPPDAPFDIVAHSMGGLVGRVLVERQGHGAQVATLTMVGTPNRGSPMSGEWLCRSAPDAWHGSCLQMEAGSPFLDGLGYAPRPASTAYATIGGSKDSVAPDRSVRLDGVPHQTVRNGCHSGTECAANVSEDAVPLTGSAEVRDALFEILAFRPGPT